MREGTYSGNYTSSQSGTADNLLSISAYAGESPKINGHFTVEGDYTRLTGIEFTTTAWTEGREPGDGAKPNVLTVSGDNCEVINCNMHDGAQGIGWWGQGGLLYGSRLYHNGYKSTGTPQGHGAYIQNNTPRKTAKHNIIFDNFGWGVHAWSNDADKVHRITLEENTLFCNGSLWGEYQPNFTMANTTDVEEELTATGNKTYQPSGEDTQNAVGWSAATDVTFTDNYTPEHTETSGVANFLANSGNHDGPAIGNEVFVIQNEYDAARLHVTIYNQAEAGTIDVDVSAYFSNGDTVHAHNVQDYDVDIQELTVTEGVVTVSMTGRTVASPYGWDAPASSFPKFGAFILVRQ